MSDERRTPAGDACASCPVHHAGNLVRLGVKMEDWDFVVALASGGFEAGPRAALSVPEPTAPVLMLIAAFAGAFSAARRDRNRSTHARWLTETRNFKTGASGFDGSG